MNINSYNNQFISWKSIARDVSEMKFKFSTMEPVDS